ncbi:MAG: DNA-directed RNA polymerase [Phycisphaeraceae bacterium]
MFRWKRFWCPRTGTYSLGDRGYLTDPEAEYSQAVQPDVVGFETLEGVPCLALLGEPGIGKSTALEACVESTRAAAEDQGDHLLHLNLSQYGSEDRLDRHLRESREVRAWVEGSGTLHLFLDSLDECRVHVPTVAALLLGVLQKFEDQRDRLRLRIACRTAEWPQQLEPGLSELWGNEGYAAYELLPLRRADVEEAARTSGLDPERFLSAVSDADAEPLAIKPITLNLLLGLYRAHGGLPSTQVELYRQGCRQLCAEISPSRRDSGATGDLDADQRMAVASRVAAVLTLCGKSAICLDPAAVDLPPGTLRLADLTGGREEVRGNTLEVGESALREALGTGLFTSRGAGLMGFAHQTYAEFLTAEYLRTHSLDLVQLTSLLCHASDEERRVVPQLAEAVAWLASMRPDLFEQVLSSDPHVLLRSDAASADHQDRHALLEGYLERLDRGELLDRDLGLRQRYGRFSHPALADQLRPYIIDQDRSLPARRAAIDIAEVAGVADLADELASVALDDDDLHHIRDQAAHAVAALENDEHRRRLIPLLDTPEDEDPDDQLRGSAMRAVWPHRLVPLERMLEAIAPARQGNLMGAYEVFLAQEFVPYLRDEEVPTVLDWLRGRSPDDDDDEANTSVGLRRLSDALVPCVRDSEGQAPEADPLYKEQLERENWMSEQGVERVQGRAQRGRKKGELATGDPQRRFVTDLLRDLKAPARKLQQAARRELIKGLHGRATHQELVWLCLATVDADSMAMVAAHAPLMILNEEKGLKKWGKDRWHGDFDDVLEQEVDEELTEASGKQADPGDLIAPRVPLNRVTFLIGQEVMHALQRQLQEPGQEDEADSGTTDRGSNLAWRRFEQLKQKYHAKRETGNARRRHKQSASQKQTPQRWQQTLNKIQCLPLETDQPSDGTVPESRIREFAQIGAKLVDQLISASDGQLSVGTVKGSRHNWLFFKEDADGQWGRKLETIGLARPRLRPMLVPPRSWTYKPTGYEGGYLSRRESLILSKPFRRNTADQTKPVGPKVMEALDALQSTPWRINRPVLRTLKKAIEQNDHEPLELLAPDDELLQRTVEQWKEMKKHDRTTMQRDVRRKKRHWARRRLLRQLLEVAEEDRNRERLYFPHRLDFRGRIYAMAEFLHMQSCDPARGLLEFAESKPLGCHGERHLRLQLARTYGGTISRSSICAQLEWVERNESRVLGLARRPSRYRGFWLDASDRWQFLAACKEWHNLTEWKKRGGEPAQFHSHLPVWVDGKCNGMQHIAAMVRDEDLASRVGLRRASEADAPPDLYTEVAEGLNQSMMRSRQAADGPIKAWIEAGHKVTRHLAKPCVMTLPYGITTCSLRLRIKNALLDANQLHPDPWNMAECLTEKFESYCDKDLKRAMNLMRAVERLARDLAAKGRPMIWTLDSGMTVRFEVFKTKKRRIKQNIHGTERHITILTRKSDTRDVGGQSRAAMAHLLHSLDAAHLAMTLCECRRKGIDHVAAVHDLVATHAGDVEPLGTILREQFRRLHAKDWLSELHKQNPLVPQGNWNPSEVREATYFFS